RAVLLDEGIRTRHGARALHHRRDRARAQGADRGRQRRGQRQHLPGLPAGPEDRRVTAAAPALLVVDDDQVARELLAETLGREGCRVRVAGGGEEALRLAGAEPFDMALVDLRMPDVDGLAVLKKLARIQPDLPVVILTAFATIETAIQAVNAGAFDYLSKPFRMEEIKIVVRRTLDARRLARGPGRPPGTARSGGRAGASGGGSANPTRWWRSTSSSRGWRRSTRRC